MSRATTHTQGRVYSLDAYEHVLKHMADQEDGIVDALFRFFRLVNGSDFWCLPIRHGHIDLRPLGQRGIRLES